MAAAESLVKSLRASLNKRKLDSPRENEAGIQTVGSSVGREFFGGTADKGGGKNEYVGTNSRRW